MNQAQKNTKASRRRRWRKHSLYGIRRGVVVSIAKATPRLWASRLRNPIFVIGQARSGTTILERLVATHQDVADWSEANMVWDSTGGDWTYSKRDTLPLWIDPQAYMQRWQRDVQGREMEIRATFGLFQTIRNKRYFMNKCPDNLWRVPYLLEHFPDAKLIYLIRDGRAVVNSTFMRLWPAMERNPEWHRRAGMLFNYEELAARLGAFWQENVIEVEQQKSKHHLVDRGILLEIQYETLAQDTSGTLERICSHVGLDIERFDPSVWEIKVDNRNYKWRENLRGEAIEAMCRAMQPALLRLGYE